MTVRLKSYLPGSRDWLHQAVVISLFSDARLADNELMPDNTDDRRGHWGDMFLPADSDSLGSLLWTLYREKLTPAVTNRARDLCIEALAWMLKTSWVIAIGVDTEKLHNDKLAIRVTLTQPNNQQLEFDVTEVLDAL